MSDAIMRKKIIDRKGNNSGSSGNKNNKNLERKEWNKQTKRRGKSCIFFFLSHKKCTAQVKKEVNGSQYQPQRCSHELESNLSYGNLKDA